MPSKGNEPWKYLLAAGLIVLAVWLVARRTAEQTAQQEAQDAAPQPLPITWAEEEVIDIHGHLGRYGNFDLSESSLLRPIERAGVRMVLVSNVDGAKLPTMTRNLDETAANQVTLETVQRHPDRLRGLLWCRPSDGSAQKIEAFLKDAPRLPDGSSPWVGIKLHPAMNEFPADGDSVDPYMRLCEKYGLVAVIHSGTAEDWTSPQRIYSLARRHPKVPVVLYHMGMGTDASNSIDVVTESIAAGDADLYLETAHAQPDAVLRAIQRLGADRVLFGSDVPWPGGDFQYDRYTTMAGMLKGALPPEEFQLVMSGNAMRLFKLKLPATRPATQPTMPTFRRH